LCYKNRSKDFADALYKDTERAGKDAMVEQLHFYFVLRDFVVPGLSAMKARALAQARGVAGEPVPEDLVAQANRLNILLQERKRFEFTPPNAPFTLSATKAMSARSITFSGDENEILPVEKVRWRQVFLEETLKSFYGRPDDINELISCGVFKPNARSLATNM
jgi:hypothetical protein